ncbi:class I SAM-dependent methyltransferase [Candidatus Micrarchaeota archaeon]|nr:class I SAM-dependent methyltransferase [Candidatus Micrarchaeota archaeon]
MKTTRYHHRLKPRQTPNCDTWLGRHQAAMEFITENFKSRMDSRRVVAWVIGIGGKEAGVNPPAFTPTEHIEVGQALEKADVRDFRLYAMDISVQSIAMAEEQLKTNTVKAARKGHPSIPKTAQGVDFVVPEKLAGKITLMGPEDSGDIFLNLPPEKPDAITIFNVARSYHRRHQTQLARRLADALREGGILLTNRTESQTVFVRTLEEMLGAPLDLGPCPDLGKPGRIVAFGKKATA